VCAGRPGGDGVKQRLLRCDCGVASTGPRRRCGPSGFRSAPPAPRCRVRHCSAENYAPDVVPLLEPDEGGPPVPDGGVPDPEPDPLPMSGQFLVEPDPELELDPDPELDPEDELDEPDPVLPVFELDAGAVVDEFELVPEFPVVVDVVAALATNAPPARSPDVSAPTARTLRKRICMSCLALSCVKRRPVRAGTAHGAPLICGQAHNDVGGCEESCDERMTIHSSFLRRPTGPVEPACSGPIAAAQRAARVQLALRPWWPASSRSASAPQWCRDRRSPRTRRGSGPWLRDAHGGRLRSW
jgi:hypothetical protein